MRQWTKLCSGIVHSTIWGEDSDTKVVWITMLAMKDWDGIVNMPISGLARLAGVSLEACERALDKFMAPDKYSRTQAYEGRRIEVVPGGWRVLNHFLYRDEGTAYRREYNRRKQAEYRAKKKKVLGGAASMGERVYTKRFENGEVDENGEAIT